MKERYFDMRVTQWEQDLLVDLRTAQDEADKQRFGRAEMELGYARKKIADVGDLDTLREKEEA